MMTSARKAAEIEAAWQEHWSRLDLYDHRLRARKKLLATLAEAQNWRCCYCGCRMRRSAKPHAPNDATFEHVLCHCHGGTDEPDNLVIACWAYNEARANDYWPMHREVLAGSRKHPDA